MTGKIDSNLNLDAGMNQKAFEKWAAFYIPEISQKEIMDFAVVRINSEADAVSLFEASLSEASAHFVEKAVCNLPLYAMKGFDTPKSLVSVVQNLKRDYGDKGMDLKFYLQIDSGIKENFNDETVAAAFSLLGSGEFLGVCFKGVDFLCDPKKYNRFIYSVQRHNQKVKIDFSLFEEMKTIDDQVIQKVVPNEVVGNSLFDADFFLANKSFLAERGITAIFTPDNFRLAGSELLNRMRILRDSGVEVKFGSGNYLFHGINLADFAESL